LAKILPFKGFLPPASLAELVSSPPYDTLSSDEARSRTKNNNKSFLRVIKPEVDFKIGTEPSGSKLHEHAATNLSNYISNGNLIEDKDQCLYIYQISMGAHVQTGIIAAVSVEEYDSGIIKKHEYTRPEKEDDRTMHIQVTKANTGPVFLTFRNDGSFNNQISGVINRDRDISFEADDGTLHSIWRIQDSNTINEISTYFKRVRSLYIADGHHRAASASRVHKEMTKNKPTHNVKESYNYFLATIFPHDEMQIMGYNRVVKDLCGLSDEQFISKLRENFDIQKLSTKRGPKERFSFTMLLGNSWYCLTAKKQIIKEDSVLRLDASILQNHILKPILKIEDPRTDKRIEFVGGIRGLEELERRCSSDVKVAFALYPVSIEDLFRVSDDNKVMPPKSTWFEPKLRSGLIVRFLD
tara:strand:+ start:584 stop:1819 length:1236 start_codon:yes stop_codon:yes gene_type:complete